MPYIKQVNRKILNPAIDQLSESIEKLPEDQLAGNLNYVITRLLLRAYGDSENTSYSKINSVIGVLECASKEYYRKVAVPYENQKEFENGSVIEND